MPVKEYHVKEIPLNGKLITAADPATIVAPNARQQTNLRYGPNNPRGVGGMTKINTAALANVQIKNGIQYRRTFPAVENHTVVAARDGSGLNQKVYRNDAVVPNAGAFSATPPFTDSAGFGLPRFSLSPEGMAYCNGVDAALWLGDEAPASGFIDYDPAGSYRYDWTDIVANALTDANNLATLHRISTTIDANTMLLLHCDGTNASTTFTDDSPTTAHTVTAVGNAQLSTAQKKFGTASGAFDGTGDYLTVPDDADFNFSAGGSDGAFTVEMLFGGGGLKCYPSGTYFSKAKAGAGTDYMRLYRTGNYLTFDLVIGSSVVATMRAPVLTPSSAPFAFRHVALVGSKSGSTYYYYLFIEGALRASTTYTAPPGSYDRAVYIGAFDNGTTIADVITLSGTPIYVDEIRVSNIARWTASFEPPTQAYGPTVITSLYVRSLLPASGIKFYPATANTAACTANVFEWNGSGWAAVSSLADGTASGGASLAQTGTMSFTSTAATSVPKLIDGIQGYWYKVEITGSTGLDATTTVSQVSVVCPMQQLRDIWDGTFRSIASFQKYASSTYNDLTTNVFDDSYDSTNTATFAELDSLAAATDFLVEGFPLRMSAVKVGLIGGHVNTAAGTVLTVYYWDGTAWVSVGTVDDGTVSAGVSFAKSGTVSWNPPAVTSEQRQTLAGSKKSESLYYYKFVFSANLSADVQAYYVAGIPAQVDLSGYVFPFYHLNRLCLLNKKGSRPNALLAGVPGASHFFNGPEMLDTTIGDGQGLVAAASVYSRFGSTLNSVALLFKDSETWLWIGNTPDAFNFDHKLSPTVGCASPLTVKVVSIPGNDQAGVGRSLAIWQAATGIYMSDGASLVEISNDVQDLFDPLHANYVGAATLATCTAVYDSTRKEYHWIVPGVAEWVFDIRKAAFFDIDRGDGNRLECGVEVVDTNGNPYVYGALATGYLERLEDGTTFDGTDIVHTLWLGDMALASGSIWEDVVIRKIKLVQVAKTEAIPV